MPDRRELVALLPALLVLGVWVVLLPAAGGFYARDWMPAGIVLAGVLVLAVFGTRRALPPAPVARVAVLSLIAFTAFCFLSMAWSDAPGAGWDESNLLLVTTLSTWTLSLVAWRPETVWLGVLAFALAAAVVCAITLVGAAGATDLTARFTGGRFNQPLDYPNTSAAFCVIAGLPALVLAARPGVDAVRRGLAGGSGAFLLGFALLPQSRGAVLGGLAAGLVLIALVPFRWRLLWVLAVTTIGLAVAWRPVLGVYDAASAGRPVSPELDSAAWALLAVTLIGAAGCALLAAVEQRVRPSDDARVLVRRGGWGLVALVVALVAAAGVLNAGRIADGVSDQWRSLKNPGTTFSGGVANPEGQNRLLTADPLERYDYFRVAARDFVEHPLGGTGWGGFDHSYTTERRYVKPSKYPHNVVLRVAGETGIVGLVLFLGLLGALLVGLLRRLRDAGRPERALSATAVAVLAYLGVHSSLDWLEAYPVILGPVLGLAVAAVVARDRDRRLSQLVSGEPTPRRSGPDLGRLAQPVAVLVAVAAAASLAVPFLALRWQERGEAVWRTDPEAAYADLRRATSWDRLGTAAPTALGLIAVQRGDEATARDAFRTSLEREETWLPHLELALLERQAGEREAALADLARAEALSPLEPVLAAARELVRARTPLNAADATRQVFEQETARPERLSP